MKKPEVSDDDRAKAKKALMDLIEECRKGPSTLEETASERLKAVTGAVDALLRL
ncbi:hypothetical protein [uncultured Slackia sp.]|uniref:hypothetical protein n=1 Tax=uncultured Slackia sp. TaxID=665903 RepID=UPI0026E0471E|nr:hypothetical protein [uncultured Slackia sp.]